jgi:hypothetical protein
MHEMGASSQILHVGLPDITIKMQGNPSFFHSKGKRLFCPSTGSTPKTATSPSVNIHLKYSLIKLMEEKGETTTPNTVQHPIPQYLTHLNRILFAFLSNLFSSFSETFIALPR